MDSSGCALGVMLRMRVAINVNHPLKRALKIRTPMADKHLIKGPTNDSNPRKPRETGAHQQHSRRACQRGPTIFGVFTFSHGSEFGVATGKQHQGSGNFGSKRMTNVANEPENVEEESLHMVPLRFAARSLGRQLEELHSHEEVLWQQRAKALWFKDGDKNTTFFMPELASGRTAKEGKDVFRNIVLRYFEHIFQSINPEEAVIRESIDILTPRVMADMNAMLTQPFTMQEVNLALKQMHSLKSPGPDGRLLTDSALVTYEMNHFLSHKNHGLMGHVFLKLDISKAYDHVEWSFLRRALLSIGFHSKFVDLIMLCLTTVSYRFLLNGEEFGSLRLGWGLRQGDS
ncbi:hypothetical protein Sango_0365100 [Sesamum angolense]|uniref:Reverse transcriptase domain-containing protein n=1 Tax=Sesamum angolense TaxID=2727404 RepID=A0AAE2C3M4_9LAMI|nr:hypothetical protein Sango_0365100 [Sesamum angolense]